MNRGYRRNAAAAFAAYYADTRTANFQNPFRDKRFDPGVAGIPLASAANSGPLTDEMVEAVYQRPNGAASALPENPAGLRGRVQRGAQSAAYDARDLAGRAGRGAAGLAGRADNAVMGLGQRVMGNRLMTNNLARRGVGYGALGAAGLGVAGLGAGAYRAIRGNGQEEELY